MYINLNPFGTGFQLCDYVHQRIAIGRNHCLALSKEKKIDFPEPPLDKKYKSLVISRYYLYGWGRYDKKQIGEKLPDNLEAHIKEQLDQKDDLSEESQDIKKSQLSASSEKNSDNSMIDEEDESGTSFSDENVQQKKIDQIRDPQQIMLLDENFNNYVPIMVSCGENFSLALAVQEDIYIQIYTSMWDLNQGSKNSDSNLFTNWSLKKLNPFFENALIFSSNQYGGGSSIEELINLKENKKIEIQDAGKQNSEQDEDRSAKKIMFENYKEKKLDGSFLFPYIIQFNKIEEQLNEGNKIKIKIKIIMIACGSSFSLALSSDGVIYSWGLATYGVLGNNDVNNTMYRDIQIVQFNDKAKIRYIAAGKFHAAALSQNQSMYTWGLGKQGQLGTGFLGNMSLPDKVNITINQYNDKQSVYPGSMQNIPPKPNNQSSDKNNEDEEEKKEEREERMTENKAGQIDYQSRKIKSIDCGSYHTACITQEGYLYLWGSNTHGQLGFKDKLQRNFPEKIDSFEHFFIQTISLGEDSTMITTDSGQIYSFGKNNQNKLAIQSKKRYQVVLQPKKIKNEFIKPQTKIIGSQGYNIDLQANFYQIKIGVTFTLGLLDDGTLLKWGGRPEQPELAENQIEEITDENNPDLVRLDGELHLNRMEIFHPMLSKQMKETNIMPNTSTSLQMIKCGIFHTAALTDAGEVLVWGTNYNGQHGISQKQFQVQKEKQKNLKILSDNLEQECLPTFVSVFNVQENRRINYLDCGHEYIIAIQNKRLAFSWGANNFGQLGIGEICDYVSEPREVVVQNGELLKQVACGENHSLFLLENGRVYCCGNPEFGKLGVGKRNTLQLSPQIIEELEYVSMIACGAYHSMALRKDDFEIELMQKKDKEKQDFSEIKQVIYTWGNGSYSKLGFGNSDNLWNPKKLMTNYNFTYIAAGARHSAALDDDKQMHVWGPYRSFGVPKPEEQKKSKKKKNQGTDIEQYEFQKPTLHPEFQNRRLKFKQIALGDQFNMALTIYNEIFYWGDFSEKFQRDYDDPNYKELSVDAEKKDQYLESILGKTPQSIKQQLSCKYISVSRNHCAILNKNNQAYTWGYDQSSGRLGLGYIYYDKAKEGQKQQMNAEEGENEQKEEKQTTHSIIDYKEQPTQVQYINQLLQEESEKQRQKQLLQQKKLQDKQTKQSNPAQNSDQATGGEEDQAIITTTEESSENEEQMIDEKKDAKNNNNILDDQMNEHPVEESYQQKAFQAPKILDSHQSSAVVKIEGNRMSTKPSILKQKQTQKDTVRNTTVEDNIFFHKNYTLLNEILKKQRQVKTNYRLKRINLRMTLLEKFELDNINPTIFSAVINENEKIFDMDEMQNLHLAVTNILKKVQFQYNRYKEIYQKNYKDFKQNAQSQIYKRLVMKPFNLDYETFKSHVDKQNKNKDDIPQILDPINKMAYRLMFTSLQAHSCYLYKIYEIEKIAYKQSKNYNKMKDLPPEKAEKIFHLIKAVYGDFENNEKNQQIYMDLIKRIFQNDIKHLNLQEKELEQFDIQKNLSLFFFLFKHLFESFTLCILMNKKMQKIVDQNIETILTGGQPKAFKKIFMVVKKSLCIAYMNSKTMQSEDQKNKFMDERVDQFIKISTKFFKDLVESESTLKSLQMDSKINLILLDIHSTIKEQFPDMPDQQLESQILILCFSSFLDNRKVYGRFESKANQTDQTAEQEKQEQIFVFYCNRILYQNYDCFYQVLNNILGNVLFDTKNPNDDSDDFNKDQQLHIAKINDFIKKCEDYRTKLFQQLFILVPGNTSSTGSEMIYFLYQHSKQNQDDMISVKFSLLQELTYDLDNLIVKDRKGTHIKFKGAVLDPFQQDPVYMALELIRKSENNVLKNKLKPSDMSRKINLKLYSRFFYHYNTQVLKRCKDCNQYIIEILVKLESPEVNETPMSYNPQSIEALFLNIVQFMKDQEEFDNITNGKIDLDTFLEHKQNQNKTFSVQNIILQFKQQFQSQLEIMMQQMESKGESGFIMESVVKKKLIKTIKQNLEQRMVKNLKYIHKMEKNWIVLQDICTEFEQILNPHLIQFNVFEQANIIKNCFIGLGNKNDMASVLENNPFVQYAKISNSINDIRMSNEIYKNVELFEINDGDPNIPSHLKESTIDLGMFGSYSYRVLKSRDAIKKLNQDLFEYIRNFTENPNLTESQIQNCLNYVFTLNKSTQSITVVLVYQESELDLLSIFTCGLLKSQRKIRQIKIQEHSILKEEVKEFRRMNMIMDISRQLKQIGYSKFTLKGLIEIINNLEINYSVYGFIYNLNKK